jgi:hypothetical protein
MSEGQFTPKIPYTSSKNPEKIRTNPENPTDFLFKNPLKNPLNPLKNPWIFKNPKIPYASSKNPEKIRTNPENPTDFLFKNPLKNPGKSADF